MSKVVISLFCLLAVASASVNPHSLYLSKIDSTKFGNTLLDSVALQLTATSKDPVANVLNMLSNLATELADEQQHHDEEHVAFQNECASSQALYRSNIEKANADIADAKSRLAVAVPALQATIEAIAIKNNEITTTVNAIDAAQTQRKKENEEYNTRVTEHEMALAAVDDAERQIALLKRGAAFLQTDSSARATAFAKISASLRSTSSNVARGYGPLVAALADLAADPQANQALVERVIDLMSKLREALRESRTVDATNEQKAIAAFTQLINENEAALRQYRADLENLVAEKARLEKDIATANADLSNAEGRLADNTNLLNTKVEQCNDEQVEYTADKADRDAERATVAEVTDLIKNRLSTLKDYIKQRVETVA